MQLISVTGVVLYSVKYKEHSKILNILTKEKGLISVMAKGCLNVKSPLRIVSENFTYATFQIYYKEDKISTLIEADVINYFKNIKTDIVKYGYLNYLTEITRDAYKASSSKDIYDIYINALLKIEEGFNPKVIANIVEIKYLTYLGVGLYLDGCVVCNSPSVVSMSHSKGGYVCIKHRTNEPFYSPSTLKMFKSYYYVDLSKISMLNIKESIINEIDEFLNTYYREYTGLYLKTKLFLDNIKD